MFTHIVDDCQAAFVEFCTVTFLTLAHGGVQASSLAIERVMYISHSFGLSLVLALTPGILLSEYDRAQGVFIEAFVSAALAVLMLAAEKHNATPLIRVGIGLIILALMPSLCCQL
ncbi:hypothetical protein BC629DRAFT_1597590 [Irpex lacteus]|nr:hypothetical protein BC629DRAFT_1597590 [Irpex lacteus]